MIHLRKIQTLKRRPSGYLNAKPNVREVTYGGVIIFVSGSLSLWQVDLEVPLDIGEAQVFTSRLKISILSFSTNSQLPHSFLVCPI